MWLSWWRICLQCGRSGFNPWVGKIPWRREQLPTPVFRPGEFHGLYSPWGCKESDTAERLSLHSLCLQTQGLDGNTYRACPSGRLKFGEPSRDARPHLLVWALLPKEARLAGDTRTFGREESKEDPWMCPLLAQTPWVTSLTNLKRILHFLDPLKVVFLTDWPTDGLLVPMVPEEVFPLGFN